MKPRCSDNRYKKFDVRSHENSKIRDIMLMKNPESRVPILSFRDYFTQSQNINHNLLYPMMESKQMDSPEFVTLQLVLFLSHCF